MVFYCCDAFCNATLQRNGKVKEKREKRKLKGRKEQGRRRDLKLKKKKEEKKKEKRKLAIQNSVLILTSTHFSNSVSFKFSLLYTRKKKKEFFN
jgi:hypothetical protein